MDNLTVIIYLKAVKEYFERVWRRPEEEIWRQRCVEAFSVAINELNPELNIEDRQRERLMKSISGIDSLLLELAEMLGIKCDTKSINESIYNIGHSSGDIAFAVGWVENRIISLIEQLKQFD